MEADEIADRIKEMAEGNAEKEARSRRVAAYVGVLAMLLALTTLGGSNATKDMLSSAITASDTWNFYQAKHQRQTSYRIAAEEIEIQAAITPGLTAEAKAQLLALAEKYKVTADRYESDPKAGEGKKELAAKARAIEAVREHAAAQDPYFDLAQAGLQIAVVLASISLVTDIGALLWVSGGLASLATFLMINGFFLLVRVPGF